MIRILIMLLTLTGCVSGGYNAPVSDLKQPPADKLTHHIVGRGETLYAIAWRYGLDYQALARANGINQQYQIYPGQRLNLAVNSSSLSRHQTPQSTSSESLSRQKLQTKKTVTTAVPAAAHGRLSWVWPARGKILQRFSSSQGLKKGIDILGEKGESVVAAASGVVVYAGEGLRGYGKLLIVKHDDSFLSAYAHNSRIMVKEGDKVKAAEKIAEIGSTGTVRNVLHFEIRQNGVPVDPERYLPRR